MNKETKRNIQEVATVTAVGTTEGAVIGAVMGVGVLSVPNAIAGGFIGGATALTTELIGRNPKRTITVHHEVDQTFSTLKGDRNIKGDVTGQVADIPLIKVPDALIMTHMLTYMKASGDLNSWKFQTLVTKTKPPIEELVNAPTRHIGFSTK